MSYVVSIEREKPIDGAELRAVAEEVRSFQLNEADGFFTLEWAETEQNSRERFVLTDGSLDITSPTDAALKAAQDLAARLDAKVMGEEGEELTNVDVVVAADTSPGCGPFAWAIALVSGLLAIYWLFN